MKHPPTEEQQAIVDFVLTEKQNLLGDALAGAAKTSTLELLCEKMPIQPVLSIAFNKRIADEMSKRLPGHVKASTINALGHRVWSEATGRRLTLDVKKNSTMFRAVLDNMPKSIKYELSDSFDEVMKIVRTAKVQGYIPAGVYPNAKRIITAEEFYGALEEIPTPEQVKCAEEVLVKSINAAYNGTIDFDDQIYMPTLFGGTFPKFPVVMGDETQDWSRLNHEMLAKLLGSTSRFIGVGDPNQSIYMFRGAMSSSMKELENRFHCHRMGLSISFRCPKSVIRKAHSRVPHMKWPEWAEEGEVNEAGEWDIDKVSNGATIICRNNAPLFKATLDLLKNGRGAKLIGAEIGPGLVKIMKKFGPESLTQAEVYDKIDKWEIDALKRSRAPGNVADKRECLEVFASAGPNLGAAIAYAEHVLFKSDGTITLLSGHKSKGHEWDNVYHLDPWRIPSKWASPGTEEFEQELNCRYVIETRAKKTLNLISMKGDEA